MQALCAFKYININIFKYIHCLFHVCTNNINTINIPINMTESHKVALLIIIYLFIIYMIQYKQLLYSINIKNYKRNNHAVLQLLFLLYLFEISKQKIFNYIIIKYSSNQTMRYKNFKRARY